jgi:hypothetical protein
MKSDKRQLTNEEKLHIAKLVQEISRHQQELVTTNKKVNPFFFMMVAANLQKALDDIRLGMEVETPPNVEY